MSVNKVILIGRLGKDPDTRVMRNSESVANVTLATSEHWTDKDDQKQERTEWHNLVFYRRLAEVVGQYLKKGAQIYIEGKLQTRKWQDKQGVDRYTTEIIVEEMKMLTTTNGSSQGRPAQNDSEFRQPMGGFAPVRPNDNFDDDIAF